MKVYVKKEDNNFNSIIGVSIVTIMFIVTSIGIFISDNSSIVDLAFAIFTSISSVCFIYCLIKRPKRYKAKLVRKEIDKYNGKQITYMNFSLLKKRKLELDYDLSNLNCYTIGENDLIVGKYYQLGIKEICNKIKYVEEINGLNNVADYMPNMNISIVFFIMEFFIGIIIFEVIKDLKHFYVGNYIEMIILIYLFFMIITKHKRMNIENDVKLYELYLKQKLEKVKSINNCKKQVGNVTIKYLLMIFIFIPILYIIIYQGMNIEKDSFIVVLQMILFLELPIFIAILYNIGYDEKLMKKYKINKINNNNINNLKQFNIFIASHSLMFPQYFIVDQNKNLILKVKKTNLIKNKFAICNSNGVLLAEIKQNLFSWGNEFIIRIIEDKPFIMYSGIIMHNDYQIIGRDYSINSITRSKSVIFDNRENCIADISSFSEYNNNWYKLGNIEVNLKSDVKNNIDIMIMTLCYTIGNVIRLRMKSRR